MRSYLILTVFAALFLFSPQVCASYIQMQVNPYPQDVYEGDSLSFDVSLVNTGDEPAYDVQASLQLPEGFSAGTAYVGTMNPHTPAKLTFDVEVLDALPGSYPVAVKTNYADANAYPFSTVSPSFIRYVSPTQVLVRGSFQQVQLPQDGSSTATLKVSNLDDQAHEVGVLLHLPDEVSAKSADTSVYVGPKSSQEISFSLSSDGALLGSSYYVFAALGYDDGGLHYSAIAPGMVRIVEPQGTDIPGWTPLVALAFFILMFIYLQFRR